MSGPALERAIFQVASVDSGPSTGWRNGRLTIDIRGLQDELRRATRIPSVEVDLTQPGEPVRIVDVLDVVAPVDKPGGNAFPGLLGPAESAGRGRTALLDGIAVISTARLGDADAGVPSIIDLAGPGAALTPWSNTWNVVLSFGDVLDAPIGEVEPAIRLASLRTAQTLAAAVRKIVPDRVESFSIADETGGLPGIGVVLAVAAEGPGLDTFVFGRPFNGPEPMEIDPRGVLDGAVVSGAYNEAGTRPTTWSYQRMRLLESLLERHGKTLRLAGVVLTAAYLDDAAAKERMATGAADLVVRSGATGAIVTTFGGGNSHTDAMLTVRALERANVRTTVLIAETNGGLTDHVPEADAMISVGNEDELVDAWRPDRVIGSARLPDGRRAASAGPLPFLAYVGSVNQLGDRPFRSVSA